MIPPLIHALRAERDARRHPATQNIRAWVADNRRRLVRGDVSAFNKLLDELDHLLLAYKAETA